jgi:hypothetical protein
MQRRWSCRPTTARRRTRLAQGVYDGRARAPYGLGLLMLLLLCAHCVVPVGGAVALLGGVSPAHASVSALHLFSTVILHTTMVIAPTTRSSLSSSVPVDSVGAVITAAVEATATVATTAVSEMHSNISLDNSMMVGSLAVGAIATTATIATVASTIDSTESQPQPQPEDDSSVPAKRQRTGGAVQRVHLESTGVHPIPKAHDWRDGAKAAPQPREPVAASIELNEFGFPAHPAPVNIFTAQVGDKVHFPDYQAHKYDGCGMGIVTQRYAPAKPKKWPAHIKVKLTTGGAKVKIVRDRNIGTDRDERTAMRDHSASSTAAAPLAAAAAAAAAAPAAPSTVSKKRSAAATPSTQPRARQKRGKNTAIDLVIDVGNERWSIAVSAGETATQQQQNDIENGRRSRDILFAILNRLQPELDRATHMARTSGDKFAAKYWSLRWAWQHNATQNSPCFQNVMRSLKDSVGRNKLSDRNVHRTPELHRRDFTYSAYGDWERVLDLARAESDLSSQFVVKLHIANANLAASTAPSKQEKKNEKRSAERLGVADVQAAQREAQRWSITYGTSDFVSLAGYARNRMYGYFVDTGASRKTIRRSERGHTVVVPYTKEQAKQWQAEVIEQVGVYPADDQRITHTTEGRIELADRSTDLPDTHTAIGVTHSWSQWLAMAVRLSVHDGSCTLNLRDKQRQFDGKEHADHIGDVCGTHACIWGMAHLSQRDRPPVLAGRSTTHRMSSFPPANPDRCAAPCGMVAKT